MSQPDEPDGNLRLRPHGKTGGQEFPADLSAEEILHELQVYPIKLEAQNEALRQSQIDLEKSHDRFVDFYEFSPVAYFWP